MIDFSTKLPDSRHSSEAVSLCNKSSGASAHRVAVTSSPGVFADKLAQMTVDPNASLVTSSALASQLAVAVQNSATVQTGWNALIPPTQSVPVAASTPTSPATAAALAESASSAADNTYWAQQPAAVQQLRNITSESEREQVASNLANQGYSIDVPVMVWGWDPAVTTQLRETDGYTWVPSALQQPVSEAPGINVPGLTPYNPASPPAGSILVG
jgi:hypothetical protein